MRKKLKSCSINEGLIRQVQGLLREERPVRLPLAFDGRLHIERQLPFLCLYRRPGDRSDPETNRLVLAEAAYLIASSAKGQSRRVTDLVSGIVETLAAAFGAFLVLEIWAGPEVEQDESVDPEATRPFFRIHRPPGDHGLLDATCDALERGLKRVRVLKKRSEVETVYSRRPLPPGMSGVLPNRALEAFSCYGLGLEIQPIYRSVQANVSFPLVLRSLHRGVSRALRRAFFEFTRSRTVHRPAHFHALGQRAVTKAMWDIDRRLAEISGAFDFLLLVTPINIRAAWSTFRRSYFTRIPSFHYRPIPVDPAQLKRRLYAVDLDRVEDPSLNALFREKRMELDRLLTMLQDRGTKNFAYGSLQVYGPVDEGLLRAAHEILDRFPGRTRDETLSGSVTADQFAEMARHEIARFRQILPTVTSGVQVTDEVTGLMVSQGQVLVGAETHMHANRAMALLQHEVGTHVLTYWNGQAQPFHLLASGLAGYDELQEGLAVLAEHLVGGLNRARLRLLAGRVVAARYLTEGATFMETFRKLERNHDFEQRTAYRVTARIYRGGGLTKDAAYLRGLVQLLEYLHKGGDWAPLFTGKIGLSHVPIIAELHLRKVLQSPPLRPTYLETPAVQTRLDALRQGVSPLQLVNLDRQPARGSAGGHKPPRTLTDNRQLLA